MVVPKMLTFFGLLLGCCSAGVVAMVSRNLLSSPCPDTFQYKMDYNGQLYGAIGVYSLDENVVQLNVELSVGNRVINNYNGHIDLATSKQAVIDDILHRRPVRYKVFFPRWERIPPKVTKILLNGHLICSGPELQMDAFVRVLTTINLQHVLTLKVQPLITDTSSPIDNLFNKPSAVAPEDFGAGFKPQPPKVPMKVYEKNPFLNSVSTTTSSTTTTSRTVFVNHLTTTTERTNNNAIPTVPFASKNPFLHPTKGSTAPPRGGGGENTNRMPFGDTCGLTVVANPLIVRGDSVIRGAFPWLVAMFNVNNLGLEYKCSGSLISHKHIVTAAHCIQRDRVKVRPSDIVFVLGKINIQRWTLAEGERLIEAHEIHVHPDYMPMVSDADIAVVALNEDVAFTAYIRPLCLWRGPDELATVVGQKGKVVGWGKDENGAIVTAEPKQTTMPIVSQETCLWSGETFKYVTSNRTFCAGFRNGSGPCNGDSGSGFIMKLNGRWMLRGVVSASTYDANKQSCDLSNYVVFTDASKFNQWLLSFIL